MQIGRLEPEPGAEWVIYDPVAKLISRYNGQITIDGLGKINASNVGCCDASKNKHGTKHFKLTGHSVIKSFELGKNWKFCYKDRINYGNRNYYYKKELEPYVKSHTLPKEIEVF